MSTPTQAPVEAPLYSGTSIPRVEDRRLLQGQGEFIDDIWMHRMGYVHFLRSPHAHARIVSIDTSRADAMPGVFATLTGDEVAQQTQPFFNTAPAPGSNLQEFALAVGSVRYVGDAVAAVLAESRELAVDATQAIDVFYEPLDAVVDAVDAAAASAPVLHAGVGTNVVWHGNYDYGDIDWALENADHVVRIDRLHFHRFSSTPLECLGAVVNWDHGTETLDIRANSQMPMITAMTLAPALGVRVDQLRWQSQDIGGAFGIKVSFHPQIATCALLSRKAGRPAKWTEYRAEHMLSAGQGNERTFLDIEVPVMSDGTILGFRCRAYDDAGAYLHYEPLGCVIFAQVLTGCYRFKHVSVDFTQTVTNKTPTCPNRGYSRLQHMWMVERLVDTVARELGFDPVKLRSMNYVQPDEYPYTTPNGCVYDSGDLPTSLAQALQLIDYDGQRARQAEQRADGSSKTIGIGIGSTLDSGTNNWSQAAIINPYLPFAGNGEAAVVKMDMDGSISAYIGSSPQGQGHETTTAQVVADELGISPEQVRVEAGFNKDRGAYIIASGTYASQFAVTGLGAVAGAARQLRGQIAKAAAYALGAEPDEVSLQGGTAGVDAERRIGFADIAGMVYGALGTLSADFVEEVDLNCRYVYRAPLGVLDVPNKYGNLTLTYASQVHACVIELDEETGEVAILDYAAVDDCGIRIHPQIVEGQVHGATALGIGAALYESFHYDADGQPLTTSFYDYHVVTSLDVPPIKTGHVESPSPFTPNGAKGMGEGGGGPLATVCAAIQDALGPDAPLVDDSHNPCDRVFDLILRRDAGAPRGVHTTSR